MKKSVLSTILTLLFTLSATCSYVLAIDVNALPNVVGSVNVNNTIDNSTHTLTSVVTGGTGAVGQNDMTGGLGSNSTWDIKASSHSQTFIGRFIDGNLTELNGKINTACVAGNCGYGDTLKVILTNPYGISFGNGSVVNANSFTVSGFDVVGAKNIKDMTAKELEAYKASLTSKFGPNVDIVFEGGNGAVTVNGSTWNIDKTAAIVAKDIDVYKGSKLSTNLNYNYGSPANQNFSNMKLITSDGVTFKYAANGYAKNDDVKIKDGKAGVNHSINIGDKNSANATDVVLKSGSIQIANKGVTDASKVNVNKAAIKGYKLINNAYGDIYLVGNDVSINDSLLETFNTHEKATPENNTYGKKGGNITVEANKALNVKDSTIATAYSTVAEGAGDIVLGVKGSGNLNIENSTIDAKGTAVANALNGKAVVNNSLISARNNESTGLKEGLLVFGKKGVEVKDSYLDASNNVLIQSTDGNVVLTNNEAVNADNKLAIIGKNSLIEDSNLTFKEIVLHDGENTNNVTVKGKTTLKDTDSKNGLTLDVNGDLVVDNSSLKANAKGAEYADAVNQDKITLNSTGNITIKNSSDITSKSDILVTANKDANVNNSKLTAKNNTITATTGNVNFNKAKIKADNKNNVNAKVDVDSECSEITGTNNDVVAENGAVTIKNTAVTATADNKITAKTNIKTANVRVKGVNNTLTAKTGNLEVVNTALVADKTNTAVAKEGKVTFKFDKALKEACTGNGCIDAVEEGAITGTDNVITADKGDVVIEGAVIKATNNNEIKAPTGSIKLKDVKLIAENDNEVIAADDVDTDCVEMEAKNNIVTAQNGKITMKNTEARAAKNNKVTANKEIKTANVRVIGDVNAVESKTNNVDLLNTQLVASTKNSVLAKKGKVTFNFDNELKEICSGNGCIDAVEDTSVKAPENEITGKDVDANLIIKPDDDKKPEDTKTVITADNVTTGAKVIYDDLHDTTGTIVGEGQLDTNGTKVSIVSPGNVNLVLKNTGNKNAGLEVKAPKVEIKSRDNQLSISKIYADELYLDQDEKFIAGKTNITPDEKEVDSFATSNPDTLLTQEGYDAEIPGRAYIEVTKGFNFDYEPSPVAVSGIYQGSFNEIKDAEGNIIGYGKHLITLDNNSTEGQFLLTYDKPFACEPVPPVIPDDVTVNPDAGSITDQTAWTRLPLQSDMIGQVGNIANGITDPSSGMIAAAAAIDVEDIDEEE